MKMNLEWAYKIFEIFLAQKRLFLIFALSFGLYSYLPDSIAQYIGIDEFRGLYLGIAKSITVIFAIVYMGLFISDCARKRKNRPRGRDIPKTLKSLSAPQKIILREFIYSRDSRPMLFESNNQAAKELTEKGVLEITEQVGRKTAYRIRESEYLFLRSFPSIVY